MKQTKRKKQSITLLEIMIVIFLIGLIGSVVGYNVKGSLDKGKAFKTTQGEKQIEEILALELSEGANPAAILQDLAGYLKHAGFCKDPDALLKDGWGELYDITYSEEKEKFLISSAKLTAYKNKNTMPSQKETRSKSSKKS